MPRRLLAAVSLALVAACDAPSGPALQPANPVALYPTPRYVQQELVALPLTSSPTLTFDRVLPSDLDAAARAAWDAGGEDRYVVLARVVDGRAVARLFAESDRAAGWATAAAQSLVDEQHRFHPAVIVDGPAFATRGLIEGYYGEPLLPVQRRCLFDAMGRLRQNVYLYGPKDDPFAHERWAEPYPRDDGAAIADAAAAARARHVDFVWAVSPGLESGYPAPGSSISFASASDFSRLADKIAAMRALGVDRFALFLDDIVPDLVYDADRDAFATPAAAHADLANRLDALVTAGGSPHLLFVGSYYSSVWPEWIDYARALGAQLAPGIDVMWTGPSVYSETISAADLQDVDAAFGRHVVIWDNEPEYPIPLDGRSVDLPSAATGLLSNAVMIQRGGSFDDLWEILGTLGDYTWNPAAYLPYDSLERWSAIAPATSDCGYFQPTW